MTEAHLRGEERGKQTVAVLLKEAEFLRNEMLLSMSAIRTLLTATITFIGALLTITAGFMAFKASEKGITVNVVGDIAKSGEKPVQFGQLVVANRWPLWIVSTVAVITCMAFLRVHVGSLAGIFYAAVYYRDFIRPKLSRSFPLLEGATR
jgi:hypothetical protein